MPAPKRRAPRRTAAAIAEDLSQARWLGGLDRAAEGDLVATLDWLSVAGVAPDEQPISRARDLLLHYISRTCDEYKASDRAEKTAAVAAASLMRLLLRPKTDTELAEVIRREATKAAGHSVSNDAVRHREDKLITEIASQVSQDLNLRRLNAPQTVEAAVHRLAPIAMDVRQQLHDGLCLTYAHVPPADPREQAATDGYYRQMVIKLGHLLLGSTELVDVGLRSPNLRGYEFSFVSFGRQIVSFLFDQAGDRDYMLEFSRDDHTSTWRKSSNLLLSTARGKEVHERWVAWANFCYPTCAFERTPEVRYMCRPHEFLTLLYDFEVRYIEAGYSPFSIPGNEPLRHHRLGAG